MLSRNVAWELVGNANFLAICLILAIKQITDHRSQIADRESLEIDKTVGQLNGST